MALPRRLIGVDWGTSALRVFRYDGEGAVVDRRETAQGLIHIDGGAFEAALTEIVEGWREGPVALILCGMVGSHQGWIEAPYVPCPADADALAAALAPLSSRLGPAFVVPGVSLSLPDRADVMRGEETKVVGAAPPGWSGLVVSPGTHAKWVSVDQRSIADFRTFMTGELFAVLSEHSLLARTAAPGPDDPLAFEAGVRRGHEDRAITSLIFGARAEVLLGRMPGSAVRSYLSGLLVGAELAGGLEGTRPGTPILVAGSEALNPRYAAAFRILGMPRVTMVDGETAAARGLWRLAVLAGLTEGDP